MPLPSIPSIPSIPEHLKERARSAFLGWDAVRLVTDCAHCAGTGLAPCSDGVTECGFCEVPHGNS